MINRIIWRLNKWGVSALRWRCRRADMGASVWHDSDQQIERALVMITPKCGMARCGCGVTESASVVCPVVGGFNVGSKQKIGLHQAPSAYCFPCSFSAFALSWCLAAPVAAPAAACPLPNS
jgi:hypothetical protein